MGKISLLSVLLFISLSSILSAQNFSILLNTPYAGEELHILAEGAGNISAEATAPNGEKYEVRLIDGEGRLVAAMPGLWRVRIGDEESFAMVSDARINWAQDGRMRFDGAPWGMDYFAVAFFALFVAVLFGLVAYSAWKMFGQEEKREIPPSLHKERKGRNVKVSFCAGSAGVENLAVIDGVGGGFGGKPYELRKKHAKGGSEYFISYEYDGELSPALAMFEIRGKRHEISSADGGKINMETENERSAEKRNENAPKAKRKLAKFE